MRRLERKFSAARAHGLQQRIRLLGGQNEERIRRRLLQLLEQRVLRHGIEILRMVNDCHTAFAVIRDNGVFRLDLTRQIDLEFGLSFVHDHQIRVHTLLHLAARQTASARMTARAFA